MASATAPSLPLHRLDLESYNHMVSLGALEGEPVELIEGLLVEMSPQESEHATIIIRLTRHLAGARSWLHVQLPLEVPPNSVPEPDLALIAEEPSPGRHPQTAVLVVEVSVSSHRIDRGVKAALYASAGVPVYWLIDVPGKTVEVRSDPGSDGYRRHELYGLDGSVPSPDQGVADLDVAALLAGL